MLTGEVQKREHTRLAKACANQRIARRRQSLSRLVTRSQEKVVAEMISCFAVSKVFQ
jgi:hypothetical protein